MKDQRRLETLPDYESGLTDYSSSPAFEQHQVSEVPPKSDKNGNFKGQPRLSRTFYWVVGVVTLGAAVGGVYWFIRQKGYGLQEVRHADYQGQVSVAALAEHDQPEDCWMEIHGLVYDLTDYAPDHPGGAEYVTDYCGMNATRAYDLEHPTRYLDTIQKYNLGKAVATQTEEAVSDTAPTQETTSTQGTSATSPAEPAETTTTIGTPAADNSTTSNSTFPATTTTTTTTTTTVATTPEGCPVQYYSTATVAQHNLREDCWYILYDRVYDFTLYVDEHPGGARRVFEHCGTNATVPYAQEKKHDIDLLDKKTPELFIGWWGEATETQYQPC